MMIDVFIIEDQRLMREGMAALINASEDQRVVGATACLPSALQAVEDTNPDVVLMDMDKAGTHAIKGLTQLKDIFPELTVILLTETIAPKLVTKAIHGNADGILVKNLYGKQLLSLIREAMEGDYVLSGAVARTLVQQVKSALFDDKQLLAKALENRDIYLNKGQLDVAYLFAKGYSNKQLAQELHFTESTIKNYVSDLYSKVGIRNRKAVLELLQQLQDKIES